MSPSEIQGGSFALTMNKWHPCGILSTTAPSYIVPRSVTWSFTQVGYTHWSLKSSIRMNVGDRMCWRCIVWGRDGMLLHNRIMQRAGVVYFCQAFETMLSFFFPFLLVTFSLLYVVRPY